MKKRKCPNCGSRKIRKGELYPYERCGFYCAKCGCVVQVGRLRPHGVFVRKEDR